MWMIRTFKICELYAQAREDCPGRSKIGVEEYSCAGWKEGGCQCPLQRRCAIVKQVCTVKCLHCGERECRSEGRKNVNSTGAPSSTYENRAAEETGFAKKHGEQEGEQDRSQSVCSGELRLIPRD